LRNSFSLEQKFQIRHTLNLKNKSELELAHFYSKILIKIIYNMLT